LEEEKNLIIERLHAETSYVFRVRVVNVFSGVEGKFSIESDSITTGKSQALGMKLLSCSYIGRGTEFK
jgi:hypothetical protein